MKFIVAGGGIGGLATALGLSRLGHHVTIMERAPSLASEGTGISLQPNAMQALSYLQLDEQVMQAGYPSDSGRLISSAGTTIKYFSFASYRDRFGWLPVTIHRADLTGLMARALDQSKVQIRFGETIESFTFMDSRVRANSASQRQFDCDALIGADGINSKVRAQLWGGREAIYSGYTCWRGMLSQSPIATDCQTMVEIWGRSARFGYMRCSSDSIYWFATQDRKHPSEGVDHSPEWKNTFSHWPAPVPEIVRLTRDDDIYHNDIFDRDPIFPWGKGTVTLLGDAAHVMTPNLGQGGAQALEDAVVLTMSIQKHDALEKALRSYEAIRHRRTRRLVLRSRFYGKYAQGSNAWRRFVRDYLMARFPDALVKKSLDAQFDFRKQLVSFDLPNHPTIA